MFNISHNSTFENLLREYDLPQDFAFEIAIPANVQKILDGQILVTELGVTLNLTSKGLYKATEPWNNQSYVEDSENHFHVDWCVEPEDIKKAFMLGVKTLILLAQKFEKQKYSPLYSSFFIA